MKRGGDNSQLSKDEYEALENEEEEAGVYKKASAEKMATRKIVKRGSKFASLGSQNTAPTNVTTPAASSSAFSSLNTTKSAPTAAGGVFGSISLTAKSAPNPPKANNVFGSIKLPPSNDSIPIGIKKTPTAPGRATNAIANGNASTSSTNDQSQSQSKMQKLNKSFMSWLDKQMVSHSVSNWSAGLQDYVRHAEKIAAAASSNENESVVIKENASDSKTTEPIATSTTSKFSGFGGASASSIAKTSSFGGFQPPASASAPAETEKKANFGGFGTTPVLTTSSTTTSTKPTAFAAFGSGATSSKPTAFTGFGGAAATKPAAPVVGFGAGTTTKPATFGSASSSTGAGGDGCDEYEGEPILEPEKIYKNENDTDEILYETNCKAFRFDTEEKEWKESGKGTLRITKEPGIDRKKILVRNMIGKITINSYIMKGMNFRQVGKGGMQFIAVTGSSSTPQSFLVKVKPSEIQTTVEKFKEAEEEAKK